MGAPTKLVKAAGRKPPAAGRGRKPGAKNDALTPKQEAFALAYVETGNASEAYRRAYDASKMKPAVINVKASQLLAEDKVAVRVAALRADVVARHNLTVDDLIDELDEARSVALAAETPQASAAISATMSKAKLLGLIVDKVDARVLTASLPTGVDGLL